MPFGKEPEIAWLAALLLGEGTIQLSNRFVSITISNSDEGIIREASRILEPFANIKLYPDKREKLWKPCYTIHIMGGYSAKVEILEKLQPYLFGKKAEIASLAIELMRSRLDKQHKRNGKPNCGVRYDEFEKVRIECIKALNKKGVRV